MKGGYQVVDFGGVLLSDTPVTIPGVYKKASTGKAILCENLVVSEGQTLTGFGITTPGSVENTIEMTFLVSGKYSLLITITNENAVSMAVTELAEASE